MLWHEGDVVAFWNGSALDVAVAVREEKQRVRLILADGKETRVPRGRLAFVVERGGGRSEDGAADRAREAAERIRDRAGRVDVDLVWQLAEAETGPVELEALVELALGADSGEHRAAVVTAFLEDGIRFVRRGDRFDPRDADSVRSLLHEREVAGRRATHREAAHAVLARAGRGEAVEADDDNPVLRAYLDALLQQAVYDLDAPDAARDAAAEALRASGLAFERPVDGAFRLLRRFGRFDHDDVNLEIERYGFRTEFPGAVLDHARARADAGFDRAGRVDLTGLAAVSIDSASTREIDDALSVEPLDGGGVRFGVHIADPSAIVDLDDPVDEEAFARGATLYFPDRKLTMLPTEIAEIRASLVAGEERPALSFLLDVDEDGETRGGRIVRSVIRVGARLDYAAVDEGLLTGGRFEPFDRVARTLERRRLAAGALVLRTADVDVRVGEDGEPVLERLGAESPSRRIVTEAMIAAGAFAARWARDAGVRLIHRTQVRPPGADEFAGRVVVDPVEIRRVRMSLRRGETGIEPDEHFALGLPAYAQVTSPLRRYQDLANHRQIVAALRDEPAPYDEDRLRRVAVATERVEIDGRRAERRVGRYWRLRALQARVGDVLEGIVVDASHRPVVDLPEIGLEEQVPGLEGAEAGRRVALRVARVEPRADILRLRPEV